MKLFGCQHTRTTWPQTRKQREYITGLQRLPGTYVACLKCGTELEYDWQRMRVVGEREQRRKSKQEALA